jgi:hypothetical protein
MKWTLYIKLFGTVKWFLQHESQTHCGLNYNEACPLPVHTRKRIVLLSFGLCYLQLQRCHANCFVKLNSIVNLETPSSDSIKPRIPYKLNHVLPTVNAFTTKIGSCTYLHVFQNCCRTGESKLKFAILKLWFQNYFLQDSFKYFLFCSVNCLRFFLAMVNRWMNERLCEIKFSPRKECC